MCPQLLRGEQSGGEGLGAARAVQGAWGQEGMAWAGAWGLSFLERVRKEQWAKALPKAKLAPKKVMVTVWWSAARLVHYSFLNPSETITSLVARWKFLALSQLGILTPCPSTELAKEEKSPARLCLLDQGEHPRGEGGTLNRAASLGEPTWQIHGAGREVTGLKCL